MNCQTSYSKRTACNVRYIIPYKYSQNHSPITIFFHLLLKIHFTTGDSYHCPVQSGTNKSSKIFLFQKMQYCNACTAKMTAFLQHCSWLQMAMKGNFWQSTVWSSRSHLCLPEKAMFVVFQLQIHLLWRLSVEFLLPWAFLNEYSFYHTFTSLHWAQ